MKQNMETYSNPSALIFRLSISSDRVIMTRLILIIQCQLHT